MIWLVRHGQSTLNATGVRHGRTNCDLTADGAAQAWLVGQALSTVKPDVIVSSPLRRALNTARIIALNCGDVPVITLDGLNERPYTTEWLETCEHAAHRARKALRNFDGDCVAVTHAGVLKGLLGLDATPPNGSIHQWQP